MATPPSFRGGSQSNLTATLSAAVEIRVNLKFRGGEGGPGKKTQGNKHNAHACRQDLGVETAHAHVHVLLGPWMSSGKLALHEHTQQCYVMRAKSFLPPEELSQSYS